MNDCIRGKNPVRTTPRSSKSVHKSLRYQHIFENIDYTKIYSYLTHFSTKLDVLGLILKPFKMRHGWNRSYPHCAFNFNFIPHIQSSLSAAQTQRQKCAAFTNDHIRGKNAIRTTPRSSKSVQKSLRYQHIFENIDYTKIYSYLTHFSTKLDVLMLISKPFKMRRGWNRSYPRCAFNFNFIPHIQSFLSAAQRQRQNCAAFTNDPIRGKNAVRTKPRSSKSIERSLRYQHIFENIDYTKIYSYLTHFSTKLNDLGLILKPFKMCRG